MSSSTTDESPPPSIFTRNQRLGVIETDRFCRRCDYNLRGLPVRHDERLDLLLVRCPECGSFDPVAVESTAVALWAARLSVFILSLWMVLLGVGTTLALLANYGLGGGFAAMIGQCFGDSIYGTYSYGGYVPPGWERLMFERAAVVLAIACLLTLGVSMVLAATCAHWPRRRLVIFSIVLWSSPLTLRLLIVLYELLASSVLQQYGLFPARTNWLSGPQLPAHLVYTAAVVLAGVVGVWVGRPVLRTVIRILLPRALRTAFAFLWRCDGQTLPLARGEPRAG